MSAPELNFLHLVSMRLELPSLNSAQMAQLAVVANASVWVLNVSTGQQLAAFGHSQGTVTATAFSQDSTIFAAGLLNEGLHAWEDIGRYGNLDDFNGKLWSGPLSPDSLPATAAADQRFIFWTVTGC
jgi:hypothetical protein